jgi:anthranilate/para-aminobenzoate synthase component I
MRTLDTVLDPEAAFTVLRQPGVPAIFFDGRGGLDGAWPCRLAVQPRLLVNPQGASASAAIESVDQTVARRRAVGGPGGTGLALLVDYDAFQADSARRRDDRAVAAFEVDATITFTESAPPIALGPHAALERIARILEHQEIRAAAQPIPPLTSGRPRTSLKRDAYLRGVTRIKEHIARGDVYQANLTQRFDADFEGDPWALYRALARATPAPRSAYIELEGFALASVSPEFFVDVDRDGRAESRPIKGTRARGATAAGDAEAAFELLHSAKDRAELVMIVDVLRNDLGRLARIGTVSVPELLTLRSYAAVHHLVARVCAELRRDVSPSQILSAVFPGGSITGAPKERATEILAQIEPCPRGFYTGCLFWFDDDGSMASSILIRTAIVAQGRAYVGAGGGVTWDSDPEEEWSEANAKARALTSQLGFDPEEAT